MQIQRIGNYTNKYSSNKNQQTGTSNPNFGLTVICEEKTLQQIYKIEGLEGLDRIRGVIQKWMKDPVSKAREILSGDHTLSDTAKRFNPWSLETSNDVVQLTLVKTDGKMKAGVTDLGNVDCIGHAESSKSGTVDATIESINGALSDWLKARMSAPSENSRRSALARFAKAQG